MAKATCKEDDCDSPVKSLGWCSSHYHKWQRYGDPQWQRPRAVRPTCKIGDCDDVAYGHGWCSRHYQTWRKWGDPEYRSTRFLTLIERVRRHAPEGAPDECWPWAEGCTDDDGYGVITVKGKRIRAHRIAWEHANDRVAPDELVVRHTCHQPFCTNPNHLRLGSQRQNVGDAVERGTWVHGETHGLAKLTTVQVDEIRALLAAGRGPTSIGRQFGVSKTQIVRIRDGVSRRDG